MCTESGAELVVAEDFRVYIDPEIILAGRVEVIFFSFCRPLAGIAQDAPGINWRAQNTSRTAGTMPRTISRMAGMPSWGECQVQLGILLLKWMI